MSISIHELLAVARESEGVKAVKGDDILCEKRFAPDTRYMVEFLVLEQKEGFEEKGEYHRYFLTKEAYRELVDLQNQGVLRFQKQALVVEGTLHYEINGKRKTVRTKVTTQGTFPCKVSEADCGRRSLLF